MSLEGAYLMSSSWPRGALHVRPVDELDPDDLFRGVVTPTKPLKFVHSSGGMPRDVITTEHACLRLLSDRVIDALQSEGITGWTSWPVDICGKGGQTVSGYQGFSILGRCGPVDRSLCLPVMLPPRVAGLPPRQGKIGFFFDPSTWDGTDMFVAANTNVIFVVERVKHLVEQLNVQGFMFEPSAEAENLM